MYSDLEAGLDLCSIQVCRLLDIRELVGTRWFSVDTRDPLWQFAILRYFQGSTVPIRQPRPASTSASFSYINLLFAIVYAADCLSFPFDGLACRGCYFGIINYSESIDPTAGRQVRECVNMGLKRDCNRSPYNINDYK